MNLETHKKYFKEEKRRHAIVAFALKTLSEDVKNWRQVHAAIQYVIDLQKRSPPREDDSIKSLQIDIIRVFVLDSLTTTMKLVTTQ